MYSSFRAIESNQKLEQEHWLRYWIGWTLEQSLSEVGKLFLEYFCHNSNF